MVSRPLRVLGLALLLALGLGVQPAHATFPGANGKLGWVSWATGNSDLYVVDPNGGAPVNLTRDPARDECLDWSPDGSRIAFDSNRDGDWDIYVMNAGGTDVRQLTFNTVDDYSPSFSPDGTQLAFSSERSGDWEIWTMNADGTGARQLTSTPGFDDEAAWSPDGSRIAFESHRAGNYDIWVMSTDGTGQTNLTRSPEDDTWPSWSPGGGLLLFERWTGSDVEIYAMAADGSGQRNLTESGSSLDRYAVFSPDGALVAYASDGSLPAARGVFMTAQFNLFERFLAVAQAIYATLAPYVGPGFYDHLAVVALAASATMVGFRPGPARGHAGVAADDHPSWQPVRAGDLAVELAGPARVKRGKAVTYTVTAGSLRTGLVEENVTVAITLSRRLAVLGLPAGCTKAGTRIRCDLGSLAPWSSRSLALRLRAPARPGPLALSAAVSGSLPDPGPAPNTVSLSTRIA